MSDFVAIGAPMGTNSPIWILHGCVYVPIAPALGVGAPNLGIAWGPCGRPIAPALGAGAPNPNLRRTRYI